MAENQARITPANVGALVGMMRQYRKPVDLFVVRSGGGLTAVLRSAKWGSRFARAAKNSASIRHVGTYQPDAPAGRVTLDLARYFDEAARALREKL